MCDEGILRIIFIVNNFYLQFNFSCNLHFFLFTNTRRTLTIYTIYLNTVKNHKILQNGLCLSYESRSRRTKYNRFHNIVSTLPQITAKRLPAKCLQYMCIEQQHIRLQKIHFINIIITTHTQLHYISIGI